MIELLSNIHIQVIKPELFLLLSTVILLLVGLYFKPKAHGVFLVVSAVVLAATAQLVVTGGVNVGVFHNGMFLSNQFTQFVKLLLMMSGVLVLFLSSGFLQDNGGRAFEFNILLMFSLLGMMLMVSAADFLSLYMALEMSSLALYVLAAFDRDNEKSNEAGLKYFVLGALASGMLLFGISLVYGFAGSTNFTAIASVVGNSAPLSKGLVLGLILVMVGFCFKLSAVPFHMWAPDVYEGAPTPVTAFFATAPKLAAVALFARILLGPFAAAIDQWQQVVVFVSLASLVVGALGAIMQTNVKRLIAYSSIGYVGFLFMALAAGSAAGVQAILVYASLYIFMCVGMFGCLLLARRGGVYLENIKDLSGLSQTSPALAIAISMFMFSMAGIPPLAGFFGKFYVVMAAVEAKLMWLAVAGVISSVISCYYYLKIVKTMYFDEPIAGAEFDYIHLPFVRSVVIIGALVTGLFFLAPSSLLHVTKAAAGMVVK